MSWSQQLASGYPGVAKHSVKDQPHGYLNIDYGMVVSLSYIGTEESDDLGWFYATVHETGARGWLHHTTLLLRTGLAVAETRAEAERRPIWCLSQKDAPFFCLVTADVRAVGPGYLALRGNERVEVLHVGRTSDDRGWLFCRRQCDNEQGWAPEVAIDMVGQESMQHSCHHQVHITAIDTQVVWNREDVWNKANGWSGVACVEDVAYFAPYNAPCLLVLNIKNNQIHGISTNAIHTGNAKWQGFIAFNGRLYCVPSAVDCVLEYDPSSSHLTSISMGQYVRCRPLCDPAILNGKLFARSTNGGVFELNLSTHAVDFHTANPLLQATSMVASNGHLFLLKESQSIIEYSPHTRVAREIILFRHIGGFGVDCDFQLEALVSGWGNAAALNQDTVVSSSVWRLHEAPNEYWDGMVATSDKVYCSPSDVPCLLEFDPGLSVGRRIFCPPCPLSGDGSAVHRYEYHSATVCGSKVYCCPGGKNGSCFIAQYCMASDTVRHIDLTMVSPESGGSYTW
eukprot:CAMPEP_0172815068 /NCGR_PEP_ID=MMETSP1075-20121228/11568_1 /TAXON_ID=2916 /ORGANISM="Ceratium fusus, Strain PA161109" /LENGTH=510 /DNA_ID=CAMNT_0013654899 /DNA_START=13 /DNA_END=1542 /DNA_ORIENTATION=+